MSLPLRTEITLPTAFAAPVPEGIMLKHAPHDTHHTSPCPMGRPGAKLLQDGVTASDNASVVKRAKLGTGAAAALNIKDLQRMMEKPSRQTSPRSSGCRSSSSSTRLMT